MPTESELLRGNTPLLVLAALADGPRHGYAIAQEINKRTQHSLKFKQGTLYPVLHTLERQGLVAGEWQNVLGERPRLVYTITEAGRAELANRVKTWQAFAGAMSAVIGNIELGAKPDEQPS